MLRSSSLRGENQSPFSSPAMRDLCRISFSQNRETNLQRAGSCLCSADFRWEPTTACRPAPVPNNRNLICILARHYGFPFQSIRSMERIKNGGEKRHEAFLEKNRIPQPCIFAASALCVQRFRGHAGRPAGGGESDRRNGRRDDPLHKRRSLRNRRRLWLCRTAADPRHP